MSKTQWEGHSRTPRTWLLDDGSTILEPLLERTTGGRRVRSAEDPKLVGSNHDAQSIAFTAVMRKAKERGRIVVCEAHDLDGLKKRIPLNFPTDPPLLHLTNDFYAAGGYQQNPVRVEENRTTFWAAWEHPALPIYFVSINALETTYYAADTVQKIYHVPLFPSLGYEVGSNGLYPAPATHEASFTWGGTSNTKRAFLNRPAAYWEGCEFWEHFPLDHTNKVLEGRREALRLMLIQSMQVGHTDTLEVPDLWTAVRKHDVDSHGHPTWDEPPLVELHKIETNYDEDTVESFKGYVTGMESAQRAAALYRQMRNELTHAGIVLGDLKDDHFLSILTNSARPFTTTITGARNAAEGKVPGGHSRRGNLTFTEQHEVVVDLVTGFVTVGCPHGDNPNAIPKVVQEAWEEAHTIAQLSGKSEAFIEFASEYLSTKAENKVLTEALARRK